jgi:hypothetical protein
MVNTAKQSQLMHNITVYLTFVFYFISPTCFGNNYAIIKGNYIELHKMCIIPLKTKRICFI